MNKNFAQKLFNLDSKLVLITGGCGQIGKSLCKYFLESGCVVVSTDKKLDNEQIENVRYFEVDVSDSNDVSEKFSEIFQAQGKIDLLVNNAGVSVFEPFEDRTEENFDWVMNVNLKGVFNCIQNYVKYFDIEKQESGNIINVASMYGLISPDPRIYGAEDRKNSEVYGATKSGVIQMTKYFAVHLAKRKIRCNSISPGGVYNPENPQSHNFIEEYTHRCPMQRMAKTEEISSVALFLASEMASYINGQNIIVDGGMSVW